MIKNLDDLKRVGKFGLKMTSQVSSKKNENSNHQEIKADLMGKFQMEDKETIFEIEPIYHSVDKIIGVIKQVFARINPDIRVEERNNIIIMTFPNLDALVDYLEILFFVSTTQAQDSL